MPWTLYRYILWELVKVLVLTTIVLVLVMSVAAAIKPLSDGLLSPVSLIKFVFFMAPTMLSVALPFAGVFAGTMVFNRMTAENEILVCRSSGINYLLIMLPVVFLGILLMLGMFYLSNWLIPRFYEEAEHTLERDVVSMVVRKVRQGEPIRYEQLILYADGAAEGEPPKMEMSRGMEPKRLVALTGVAVGRLDKEMRVREDGTAERADLLLYASNEESWIMLQLRNARYFGDEESGQRGVTEELTIGPYQIESPFREKMQFLSLPELRRLKDEPERERHVRTSKEILVGTLAREQLLRAMLDELAPSHGVGKLVLDSSIRGERYVIRAPKSLRGGDGLTLDSDGDRRIEVDRYAHGVISERRFRAKRAEIKIETGGSSEPQIALHLYELEVINTQDAGRATEHPMHVMPRMRWPQDIVRPLYSTPLPKLMKAARHDMGGVQPVAKAIQICELQIGKLLRRSMGQFHERVSLAVGALLMIVLGAILSMRMEGRLALVVYFWAFILAALSVVVTHSGSKVVHELSSNVIVGLLALWSGNLIVLFAVMATYWRLERN